MKIYQLDSLFNNESKSINNLFINKILLNFQKKNLLANLKNSYNVKSIL